jgi:hypothetical protein
VAAVYVAGAGHFEPAHNALVYVVGGEPEPPLGSEDRRAYQLQLKHFLADSYPQKRGRKAEKVWARVQSKAIISVDGQGRPTLEVQVENGRVEIGVTAENVLSSDASPELVRQLLTARLQAELRRSPPGISETEVARDWDLLQKTMAESNSIVMIHPATRADNTLGNRP